MVPGRLVTVDRGADRPSSESQLDRIERLWGLSSVEAAELLGVPKQAYDAWRTLGVPADRLADVADLDAATNALLRHVREDRISVVVRRSADSLDGESLLELAGSKPSMLHQLVEELVDLRRIQP